MVYFFDTMLVPTFVLPLPRIIKSFQKLLCGYPYSSHPCFCASVKSIEKVPLKSLGLLS